MNKNGARLWISLANKLKMEVNSQKDIIAQQNQVIKERDEQITALENKIKEMEIAKEKSVKVAEIESSEYDANNSQVDQMIIANDDEVIVDGQLVEFVNVPTDDPLQQIAPGSNAISEIKGNLCEKCNTFIKGPKSKLKTHQGKHCGPKVKLYRCVVCKKRYTYELLLMHYQWFKNDKNAQNSKLKNHHLYSKEQMKKISDMTIHLRKKMIEHADENDQEKPKEDDIAKEINKKVFDLAEKLIPLTEDQDVTGDQNVDEDQHLTEEEEEKI